MKKIIAGVLGLTLAVTLAAPVARVSAQTVDMNALLAQIATLQAQLAGMQGGSTSASMMFTTDLTVGSRGASVTALQNWLITKGYLAVGNNTGYFGALTQAAVAKYQMAKGISPAAGYFGPVTRAAVNAEAGMTIPTTTTTTTTTTTSNSSNNNDDDDSDLNGGEASLEDLQAEDAEEDDVSEGDSAEVAEFKFDVEDGDVRVERLDLSFESDATGSEEDEPWNTFDTITLLDDEGDKIAEEDVSEEDDWLENDDEPYEFRFNDLDYVVKEGDEGKITVKVEVQDGIDGLTNSNDIVWTLFIDEDGLRALDGEGLDQYIGDEDEQTDFDITEEGSDDDLSVRRSSEDPDSTTFQVEDDGTSDWYKIFAFDLDSDEDSDDIEINDLPITLATNDRIGDVYNDLKVKIDGDEFDDRDSFSSSTATTATTTFDIDGDYTVKGGDRVTVEVWAEFKTGSTTNTYPNGTTISASVVGANIDAEGEDDVDVDGNASGDTHTLRVSGVDVEATGRSNSDQAPDVDGTDNDVATFYVDAKVSAFDQDVFISKSGPTAFTYQIEDQFGNAVSVASTTATSSTVSSDADSDGAFYVVDENSSETFRLQVTFNPSADTEGKQYRLQILTINFNDTADAPDTTYTATPASDFESNYKLIVD